MFDTSQSQTHHFQRVGSLVPLPPIHSLSFSRTLLLVIVFSVQSILFPLTSDRLVLAE